VRGLVLAAGRSSRIGPISGGRPKPLLEVGGRSLLEWNLRWLVAAGVGPIWVNLHYRGDEVRRAVDAMELGGADVRFSEEDPILGTAGAWRALAGEWDGTSLVVYGDNLCRFDLASLRAAHAGARAGTGAGTGAGTLATVALFDPARHGNTGIAGSRVLVDESGRVTGFEETRGGSSPEGSVLVSTGACLLEPAVAERMEPGFSDFGRDVFPDLVADGALAGWVVGEGGFCLGLDTPEHFEVGVEMVATGRVRLDTG
jgi:NDP-sugar pyrophosphorylase family protein